MKLGCMATLPNSGAIANMANMTPKDISDNIEMVVPIIPIVGYGPVSVSGMLVLNTYHKILELRCETRRTELGIILGDRSLKRCYQQALRDHELFHRAPETLQREARKSQYMGAPYVFENSEQGTICQ